ncbi:MAG: dual specificity protein phosphatase family protein [Sedimentisphaerales bacterium]
MTFDRHKVLKMTQVHKRQIIIAAVALCLIVSFGLWQRLLKNYFIPKNFGVVEEGLIYRSGQLSGWLIGKTLNKYNIKVIVSLTGSESKTSDRKTEEKTAKKLGIERLVFPLGGDGVGDINNYTKAIAAICLARKEGKRVLVHCGAGAQRAGGVIAAYRLLIEKKDVPFVLNEMRNYGWNPENNPNLLPYLNSNMEELASLLKQKGVIDKIPNPLPQITLTNYK